MSELLPDTCIVRAFSCGLGFAHPRRQGSPGSYAAPYTADELGAGLFIEPLVFDMGYVPIRIGDLDDPALDIGGALWPGRFTLEEMRSTLGWHTNNGLDAPDAT